MALAFESHHWEPRMPPSRHDDDFEEGDDLDAILRKYVRAQMRDDTLKKILDEQQETKRSILTMLEQHELKDEERFTQLTDRHRELARRVGTLENWKRKMVSNPTSDQTYDPEMTPGGGIRVGDARMELAQFLTKFQDMENQLVAERTERGKIEAEKRGAEKALTNLEFENEKKEKKYDQRLKRMVAYLAFVSAIAGGIAYLATHFLHL